MPAGSPRSSECRTTCSTSPTRSTTRSWSRTCAPTPTGAPRTPVWSATGRSSSGPSSDAPRRSASTPSPPVTTRASPPSPTGPLRCGGVPTRPRTSPTCSTCCVSASWRAPDFPWVSSPRRRCATTRRASGSARPPRPRAWTCASSPGVAVASSWPSASPRTRARSSTRRARPWASTTASPRSRSASGAASGSRRAIVATWSTSMPARQP